MTALARMTAMSATVALRAYQAPPDVTARQRAFMAALIATQRRHDARPAWCRLIRATPLRTKPWG